MQLLRPEGAVGARIAADYLAQRVRDGLRGSVGQAAGRHGSKRVAVEPRLIRRDPSLLVRRFVGGRPAFVLELVEQPGCIDAGEHTVGHLLGAQVAEAAQHFVRARLGPSRGSARERR